MNEAFIKQLPTSESERVVVDEIFENGTVRLLRAKRLPETNENDLGVENWDIEQEDFQRAWLVAAFVGYPSNKKLQEGDVFFFVNGEKLDKKYKPIKRDEARKKHLLRSWGESRDIARTEIKTEYYKLSASQLANSDVERDHLFNKIETKIQFMSEIDGDKEGE